MSSLNGPGRQVNANGRAGVRGYVCDVLATTRCQVVAFGESVDEALREIDRLCDVGVEDDVVVWLEGRVAAVVTEGGKTIHITRTSLIG
jgi:hypothetical protein